MGSTEAMNSVKALESRIFDLKQQVEEEKLKLRVTRNTVCELKREVNRMKVSSKRTLLSLAHYRKYAHEKGVINQIEAGIAEHLQKEGL
jgi:hypothetical protein